MSSSNPNTAPSDPASTTQASYEQLPFAAPAGATEILLVRHGASQAYVPGEPFPMLGPQGDPPLSPLGREQAKLVGARLSGEPIDAVYVTRLQRTVETSQPLIDADGMTSSVNPHLHEIFLGEWEGGISRVKMAEGTDPVALDVIKTGTFNAVPGAETADEFSSRCRTGIEEIVAAHPGGNVVSFVHGGVISMIAKLTAGGTGRIGPVDNCSITHLVVVEGRWLLSSFNDTGHLGGLFTRTS